MAIPAFAAAEVNFGKAGDKVDLVVGYQPYYTESWSGVVNNGKAFWKKYLPAGSTAEFQVGLQGAVIVNAMTGEKQHIGYAGDMPSIAATFRNQKDRGGTDIRIVAVLGTSKQQCNLLLVRNDAPNFTNAADAMQWMAGKQVSSPHGSCTDRFARLAFKKAGIEPKTYLNQNIEVITTNFRAGKLDAAVDLGADGHQDRAGGLGAPGRERRGLRRTRRRILDHAERPDQAAPRRGACLARVGAGLAAFPCRREQRR